ncbi:glycosyltransferase family 2 protein [uncultured Pseudoteredinibacter sp.]|uniref:glycosyltransferase family 2 protein n=1 Tax=uncultured Pseudoteredinibacter sp. TaxID=1641701 RepID=UPI00260187F4|nr:glycosyltransferase family 2 protein [uncultured Pseudoteredinibacter sp.]
MPIREGLYTVDFIVPVYNEAENIHLFENELSSVMSAENPNINYSIIFVNDGSSDESWKEITLLSEKHPNIIGINFARNFGKEAAMEAGLMQSRGDAAIVIDADLQHPIDLVPNMISAWENEDYKIVSAVKSERQSESYIMRIFAGAYYHLFTKICGFNIQKASDFKLLDREIIARYLSMPEQERFFRGLIAWMGYPEKKLEFKPLERIEGESSWSIFQLFNYAKNSLLAFSYAPLKLIGAISYLMLLVAFILTFHSLYTWASGDAHEGFTTVIILQLLTTSMIMVGLHAISSYIAKIYDELKGRPRFLVQQTVGLGDQKSGSTDILYDQAGNM